MTTEAPRDGATPPRGFATEQIHAGDIRDSAHGARVAPIHMSAGFAFDSVEQARERFAGEVDDGYVYTRYGNPTIAAVERKLAALEGGVDAIAVASGQAAVTVALLGLLQAGDHLLSARSIYEGSRGLFRDNFTRLGIEVSFVDDDADLDAWRAAIRPSTRALFGESIPNPRNNLLDIAAIADIAHERGVPLVIDSTLATPYLLRPIEYGADVVVHSTSKFLAGHGASLGGVVIYGADALADPVFARRTVASRLGPTPSPLNTFLLQQGIETLSLRMERHSSNAQQIAEWLEAQPEIVSVDYAGLPSHPQHDLAVRTLPRGAGSVFSFTFSAGFEAARIFIESVELFTHMSHLGDVRSLIQHPASTSHVQLTEEERVAAGILPGTVRVSVGIEDVADLIRDLELAITAVRSAAPAVPDAAAPHAAFAS
ncbi:MAG TPA: aminotransferase class I/II-fold pyridoxal phosphate-dependent enzyme [Pseudolysinimonas sp.]|nr:aminotransferase class I/II-fold pyridoxal phosphate-dependent enzyme [Pseudolysinimonas sp.]